MDNPLVGGRYRHYKNGKEYLVLSIWRWQEDAVPVVVYQGQYDDPEFGPNPIWVRTVAEFVARVEYNGVSIPRFSLIFQ